MKLDFCKSNGEVSQAKIEMSPMLDHFSVLWFSCGFASSSSAAIHSAMR